MEVPLQSQVLDKELTRKQFLQLALGSGLALFGFGNLLSFLKLMEKPKAKTADAGHGFGSRKFGA